MRLLLLLAEGFEEIEALGTADLLRRGGLTVTLCSIGASLEVMGAHGICVRAEAVLEALDASGHDGLVLPGGLGGSKRLAASPAVRALLAAFDAQGKWICAICAAPALVLTAAGVLRGRRATCYPAPEFLHLLGESYAGGKAVVDGRLITAEGPGRVADFAGAILKALQGEGVARTVLADARFD